jgi:DegV family protein with EDD domain
VSFWIVSDTASDLPAAYVERHERFTLIPMPYLLDGAEGFYEVGDEKNVHSFYQKLRDGKAATTSQVNQAQYYSVLKDLTDKGEGVLLIPLSGGISGSVQSANLALSALKDVNPKVQVRVVDSLCASLGQGLLLHYALEERSKGKTLEEVAEWLEIFRQKIIQWFTVDDLNFLFRGGRVSRSTAFVGTMLGVKPVLHVDWEGRLIPMEKVQGRKRSIRTLSNKIIENASPKEGQTIFISHGDCEEDAEYLKGLISEGLPNLKEVLISPCGCVVGAHSGPGTLAVFAVGEHR